LVIVCAIHAPHCPLRPRLRGAFLLLFPSDSTPLFNIRHATQEPRRKQRNRWMWMWILESANLSMHRILHPIRAQRSDEDHTSPGTRMPTSLLDIDRCQGGVDPGQIDPALPSAAEYYEPLRSTRAARTRGRRDYVDAGSVDYGPSFPVSPRE
jgi:hypothetical protein